MICQVFIFCVSSPIMRSPFVLPFLWKSQNVYISESENMEYRAFFYGAIVVFAVAVLAYKGAQRKLNDPVLFQESQMGEAPSRGQKTVMIVSLIFVSSCHRVNESFWLALSFVISPKILVRIDMQRGCSQSSH